MFSVSGCVLEREERAPRWKLEQVVDFYAAGAHGTPGPDDAFAASAWVLKRTGSLVLVWSD